MMLMPPIGLSSLTVPFTILEAVSISSTAVRNSPLPPRVAGDVNVGRRAEKLAHLIENPFKILDCLIVSRAEHIMLYRPVDPRDATEHGRTAPYSTSSG